MNSSEAFMLFAVSDQNRHTVSNSESIYWAIDKDIEQLLSIG